jgi:hypothetical protein
MLQFNGVELNVPFFPRSVNRGDIDYERKGGMYVPSSRSKTITIVLSQVNKALRQKDFVSLIKWMGSDYGNLIAYDVPDGYLTGVFEAIPDTGWGKIEDIDLRFLCDRDPYYHALTENNQSVYNQITVQHHHVDWRIEQTISNALTNARWSCEGKKIELTEVPTGTLVIDSLTQSVRLNGESIMRNLTIDSRFPVLNGGTHTFTLENGAGGTIYTREAWL